MTTSMWRLEEGTLDSGHFDLLTLHWRREAAEAEVPAENTAEGSCLPAFAGVPLAPIPSCGLWVVVRGRGGRT